MFTVVYQTKTKQRKEISFFTREMAEYAIMRIALDGGKATAVMTEVDFWVIRDGGIWDLTCSRNHDGVFV